MPKSYSRKIEWDTGVVKAVLDRLREDRHFKVGQALKVIDVSRAALYRQLDKTGWKVPLNFFLFGIRPDEEEAHAGNALRSARDERDPNAKRMRFAVVPWTKAVWRTRRQR